MKQRRRILHIENNVLDRDSVLRLFHPDTSLCSEVFHFGSVDASRDKSVGAGDYLRFIGENRNRTDFIILDLGLSVTEENELADWYASAAPDFEEFPARSTGFRILERLIRNKLFAPERIAIYTQFHPGDDLFKNLTLLGKQLWDGVVIQAFYKGDSNDALALKDYVEKQCGVSTMWVYHCSSDREVRKRIELTIQQLNTISDTDLVLGCGECEISGACDRYPYLYQERCFRMALIDIVQLPGDVALIVEIKEKEEWADMRKLSTVPLIRKIDCVGKHRTHIIALTDGAFKPGMVRVLMDPALGIDQVLDLESLERNSMGMLALMKEGGR